MDEEKVDKDKETGDGGRWANENERISIVMTFIKVQC